MPVIVAVRSAKEISQRILPFDMLGDAQSARSCRESCLYSFRNPYRILRISALVSVCKKIHIRLFVSGRRHKRPGSPGFRRCANTWCPGLWLNSKPSPNP